MEKVKNRLEDEVDVRVLVVKIISIIKKGRLVLIISVLTGLLAGVIYKYTKRPLYRSNLTISSEILQVPSATALVSSLQALMQDGNHEELALKLGMNVDEARLFYSIFVENIFDKNESEEVKIFKMEVVVYDNKILKNLERGIINYLEQNDFVKKRVDVRRENIKAEMSYINNEMAELTLLKKEISNADLFKKQNGIILYDPISVYKEGMELFRKELELNQKLELSDGFQIVQGFTPLNKPFRPKLAYNLSTGLFIGLLVGMSLIFIFELRQYLMKFERET